MSQLIQLLIGKELARVKGIEATGDQFRIGAIAAVVPNPMLGLVLANAVADREAPVPPRKPPPPPKPTEPPTGKGSELTTAAPGKGGR